MQDFRTMHLSSLFTMSHTSAGTDKTKSNMAGANRGIPHHCEIRAMERMTKSPPYVEGHRMRLTTKSALRHDTCFSSKKELLERMQDLKDENLRLYSDNVSLQKEFRCLEDQIEVERMYYSPDCETIKRENKRLREKVTELTDLKDDYLQKLHTADRDICLTKYNIEQLDNQLLQKRQDFYQLEDEDEGLRTECQALGKQLKEAERKIATVVNRLKKEKQKNEVNNTCKHELEVELKQITLEKEQLRQAIEKMSVESEQLKSLYPLFMQTFSNIKKENYEMRTELDDTQRYESLLKDANENIEVLENSHRVKNDQIRLMQERLNTWETAKSQESDLHNENKRLSKTIAELQTKVNDLKKKRSEAIGNVNSLESQMRQMQEDKEDIEQQFEEMKKLEMWRLKDHIGKQRKKIDGLQQELGDAKKESESLRMKEKDLIAKDDNLQTSIANDKLTVKRLQTMVTSLETQNSTVVSELRWVSTEREDLLKELQKKNNALLVAEARERENTKDENSSRDKINRLESLVKELDKKLSTAKNNSAVMASKHVASMERQEEMKRTINQYKERSDVANDHERRVVEHAQQANKDLERYHDLVRENNHLERKFKTSVFERDGLQKDVVLLNSKIRSLEKETQNFTEKEVELKQMHEQYKHTMEQSLHGVKRNSNVEDQCRNLHEKNRQLEHDLGHLKHENTVVCDENAQLSLKLTELSSKCSDLSKSLECANETIKKMQEQLLFNASQDTTIEKLSVKVNMLETNNSNLKDELVKVQRKTNSNINTFETERTKLQSKYKAIKDRLHCSVAHQDDLESEVKRLTSENTFLQHSLDRERKENEPEEEKRNKDRQITTLQKLCEKVSQELEDANRDTQELRDKNEILRQQIEQVNREQETDMANINNNLQDAEKKNVDLQNELCQIKSQCSEFQAESSLLKGCNDKLGSENNALNEKVRNLHEEILRLEEGNCKLKESQDEVKNVRSAYRQLKEECERLERNAKTQYGLIQEREYLEKIDRLTKEKDDLLYRLSQIASSKLTEGNPAIVDLSDEKRPTKLAEIYSELYDNEWTDAFDEQTELFKGTEQKVIDILLTILKFVHETCHKASKRYLEGMQNATSDASIRDGGDLLFEIGPGGNAPHQLNGILRQIRQLSSPFLLSKIKERLSDQWNRKHIQIEHKTRAYIEKCLDLCWDMSVKDPPVVLMSLPVIGSDYNKDRYRFYTESGQKISYVVWPGMLLHEGGPILAKGVVQGKKT